MITTTYNKNENIIYRKRKCSIYLNDLLKDINQIALKYEAISDLFIIEDTRGSISKFSDHDYKIIIDALSIISSKFNLVKVAFIADNPENAALAVLFENDSTVISNYVCKTFSTYEAAKIWLISSN